MARRNYQRKKGKRRLKKMFLLSTEGTVTEPQYFSGFNSDTTVLHVRVIRNRGSSPEKVLREMKRYLQEQDLQKDDEAWLVVDTDNWTDAQLTSLHQWSQKDRRYGFAVSNPMFEYWLLLHFEDGNGITSPQNCITRLKRHLPNYDKGIHRDDVLSRIADAIHRAERKDTPACSDWPHNTGTTVYRLVKNIQKQ